MNIKKAINKIILKIFFKPCCICGYIEKHGNYIDNDGKAYCDECLISGEALEITKVL